MSIILRFSLYQIVVLVLMDFHRVINSQYAFLLHLRKLRHMNFYIL